MSRMMPSAAIAVAMLRMLRFSSPGTNSWGRM
jgi:hypothetical protein